MTDESSVHDALHRIAGGLAELLGIDALRKGHAAVERKLARILRNQELLMADFTDFNAKLDEQSEALVEAQERIAADVQELEDRIAELSLDDADQAQIDSAVERLRASTDVLKGIDPVKSTDVPTPEPEPTPAPAEPTV